MLQEPPQEEGRIEGEEGIWQQLALVPDETASGRRAEIKGCKQNKFCRYFYYI